MDFTLISEALELSGCIRTMSPVLTMQLPEQGPSEHLSNMISSRPGGRSSQPEVYQQMNGQQSNYYQQRDQGVMNGESHHHENGLNGYDGHGGANGSRQHTAPFAGPVVATTAISRQNSTSSTASSALNESSENLLRQTLSGNGQPLPDGRQSRKKTFSPTPTTSRTGGLLGPAHTSTDFSSMESTTEESFQEFDGGIARHGFEDEYNSEAYLALLEQVGELIALLVRNALRIHVYRYFTCTIRTNVMRRVGTQRRRRRHSLFKSGA